MDEKDKAIIINLVQGKTAKEIAPLVNLSDKGVEKRMEMLRKKYNSKSAAQLIHQLYVTGNMPA